ncbi:MAG: hypothetical protein U0797_02045 [Gemmataceae bacterium]
MTRDPRDGEAELVGFFGVGLDGQDEHTRLTRADHFVLLGGSAQTHEQMQDAAIYFNEELKRRGKGLQETSRDEAIEILHKALDR